MRRKSNAVLAILFLLSMFVLLTACQQHEHAYGEWEITTAANCTEDGVETRTCSCGEAETRPITATGHAFGEWAVTTAATCTANGVETRTCSCGEEETKSINATGHSFGNWTVTTAATCTANGVETRACSCGEEETKSINATGHSFGNWTVTTAATCTANGVETRTCKCGSKETKPISATGHNWSDATCTAPATCIKCSTTSGSALGHAKGSDGYCTRCGDKLTIDMNTVVGHPDKCSTTEYFGFCFYKNSVDGIKVCWGGQNLSGKTVNYYSVTIYFYNAVGDPAYSEITGESSKTVRYVGPVDPDADLIIFGVVDYVPVCAKIVIGEITLEYADGTSDTGWYGWSTTYKNSAIK